MQVFNIYKIFGLADSNLVSQSRKSKPPEAGLPLGPASAESEVKQIKITCILSG